MTGMKFLATVLGSLIVLIQYPLWFGKGGWLRVWEVDRQLSAERSANEKLVERNARLEGDVRDLKHGLDSIDERARYELGMTRRDEVFFQYEGRRSVQ